MPTPRIKFDYSVVLTYENERGHEREVLCEGEYSLDSKGDDLRIDTCTADISDYLWETLDEALCEQAGSDWAEYLADRADSYAEWREGQADDRALERELAE